MRNIKLTCDNLKRGNCENGDIEREMCLDTFTIDYDCSVILTWVLERVKIGPRPLNSIDNLRVLTPLLKCYQLPLAHNIITADEM